MFPDLAIDGEGKFRTTGNRGATMTHHRNSLLARLAVPLTGLLIAIHFLLPEERIEATASRNELVDRLLLSDTDGFEILQEYVYSKEQLFDHTLFKTCFDNRQVWGGFQMVRTGQHTLSVNFVDFRNEADTEWAKRLLNERFSEMSVYKSDTFGTVLVYIMTPPETPMDVLSSILRTIEEKVVD